MQFWTHRFLMSTFINLVKHRLVCKVLMVSRVTERIVALELNSVCANITTLLQSYVLYSSESNEEFPSKFDVILTVHRR